MKRILPCVPLFFLSVILARGQGFTPEDAVKRMKVPEGFQVKLVASEPDVRQPVSISFDDKGRLWVLQYLQYPTPAGLKPVKVDQFLRTEYDKIPEPPPKGPKGDDKLTILEDKKGDGHFTRSKDFVTGLNLASGFAIGHGGVYIVQPPYLLFYADKDGDDVPDGDPEVLLSGFGMQDAHAFPNSLQWGPDGWLYGAQGSTVTSKIRGIEFQQGIWRFHPVTKKFELFSEGGGNTWGLDFDAHGNAIAGTNWGGFAMLHQVQGGYYIKGFGKHGPLHNPHTYGYFDHIPCPNFQGGHVTCGGIIYQGGAYPEKYNGSYIAGNLLSNSLIWYTLDRKGSTFTSKQQGDFLTANDTWFRPIDCLTGPDGSVYVADWYDKRANHVDPVDNWDRTNGRVYKIEYKGTKPVAAFDLYKKSSKQLVELLNHPNSWFHGEARRILAERRDKDVVPVLRDLTLNHKDGLALEALWALYVSGGLDDETAAKLLTHSNEDVRAWTIRLLGDAEKTDADIAKQLVAVARGDASATVRSQLACTCKRVPAAQSIPIIAELLSRTDDVNDPFIPMLLWWAVEDKAISSRELVLSLFEKPEMWKKPLARGTILERLARRYMAEGNNADYATCARLISLAPDKASVDLLVGGMDKALEGKRLAKVPAALEKPLADLWSKQLQELTLVRFALRLGSAEGYDRAVQLVGDGKTPEGDRISLVDLLGQIGKPECAAIFLKILEESKSDNLRGAALNALQSFTDPKIADGVLSLYAKLPSGLRGRAQTFLLGRQASARAFLEAVDTGKIADKEVAADQVRPVLGFKDEQIDKIVEKHWGKLGPATAGEKVARIRSIALIVSRGGPGNAEHGRELFKKDCATCHALFGEGNKIGPDLTTADRKNRDYLITQIVDPSLVIREEYLAYRVTMNGGRVLTGLIVEQSPGAVTLVNEKNERSVIPRSKIDEMTPLRASLMPEKILDPFSDEDLRDLFTYLQSDGPPKPKEAPANDKNEKRLKVCLVSGSLEYDSDGSLAAFQKYLEENYPVVCTRAFRKTDDDLPGLDNLETCDVMLLFTRRLTIKGEQLDRLRAYCKAGKPIVAVRTASHAFQNWLELDKEVLGGNYKGHYGDGPPTQVSLADRAKEHPILAGVKAFQGAGSLYKNTGQAEDVEVLLTGNIPDHTEPLAWTRVHNGGRVFYTSLGHPKDFQNNNFKRLLVNALYWTTKRDPPKSGMSKGELNLLLRSQAMKQNEDGHNVWQPIVLPETWKASETAVLICDMWDKHWSKGANDRVAVLAPRVNTFVKATRENGVTIIHAPSETMDFYAKSAARKRVLAAPKVPYPAAAKHDDPPQPVDSSDGGSDTNEKGWFKAWTRQNAAIEIDEENDVVSDNGEEIWNFLQQKGIKNVLICGVHTNMCVLNRSFAIKALVTRGVHVVLVRDLTDTMYNPAKAPYVSHEEGTRLVVEYIEKFWCPTVSSDSLLAKPEGPRK
jgi:putative membrane-bound dehydrogenase-like protein